MDTEDSKSIEASSSVVNGDHEKSDKMFTLKKWNAVAMWSWDVECDTCAICRVQVMDACLRCQSETKGSFQRNGIKGGLNHYFTEL